MTRPLSIAIVGAGMGGLAAAAALRRVGIEVTVYEQATQFARIGAGIQIGCNAMQVLRGLGLEARLRGTNMRHKGTLPEPMLRTYAGRAFAAGFAHVVLGHFHHETRLELEGGTLWILPDWRSGRRFLRFDAAGTPRFEAFEA